MLEGAEPVAFELEPPIERLHAPVPARPPLVRGASESLWLRRLVNEAAQRGEPFRLVHSAHLPAPVRLGIPFTLTIHDLRALTLAHTSISRRAFGRFALADAVQRARVVITVSESVRAELLARFRVAPERVRVVPNAADHFTPIARRPAPESPILHVGHLEPRKNLELVLRALAEDPFLPDFLLAGAPKADEDQRLAQLAAELGVARSTWLPRPTSTLPRAPSGARGSSSRAPGPALPAPRRADHLTLLQPEVRQTRCPLSA